MQLQRCRDGERSVYLLQDSSGSFRRAVSFEEALTGGGEPVSATDAARLQQQLLVPCEPSKIICIGVNYRKHAEEMNKQVPDEPLVFSKPPTSLLPHDGTIILPLESEEIHYEAELAVVIGKRCRRVAAEDAQSVIFGYTLMNDVTARDLQRRDVQFTRAKGFDTFAPTGPAIVTGLTSSALHIRLRVNGEERQSSPVSDMIFSVEQIIAHVSAVMTLEPGDIIATGTPSGVGELRDGDVVEVEIAGIGVLRNRVQKEHAAHEGAARDA